MSTEPVNSETDTISPLSAGEVTRLSQINRDSKNEHTHPPPSSKQKKTLFILYFGYWVIV